MTKLFLDTNIVIDLLERREPYCYDAVRLFTLAFNKNVSLFVSPMTYATASYLLRKHGKDGVKALLQNLRSLTNVTTANEQTIDQSLVSKFDDFEDALQYFSAKNSSVDVIITRNGKDFTASTIPVMTAEEYLEKN